MENQMEATKELALESIITTAVQIPGVKVNREKFLAQTFAAEDVNLQEILENGPVQAGCPREKLLRIAGKLILKRTSQSSIASFTTGLPGGVAMAATIPADVLQFFGMTLRLAQELTYLYGAQDLWQNGEVDDEKVRNQLMLYCGVMFGVSGAVAGVRVLSTQVAKTALKKIPQKALTKAFWYPLIKQIGKAIGIKVTKSTLAQGVSKAIPVIGGVISGSLNFASMLPMANRLHETLDHACFGYTEEEMNADVEEIENIERAASSAAEASEKESVPMKERVSRGIKNAGAGISGFFAKHQINDGANPKPASEVQPQDEDVITRIERLSKLKDMGAVTQEEFESKKKELLSKL